MTHLYHITHMDNLAGILDRGGLLCDRGCQIEKIPSQQIGYAHIKQRRMIRKVPLAPKGTLGDYVPFYFAPRSPMLFTIEKRNTPAYQDGQRPIVHLVTSVEAVSVAKPKLRWLFTDGHADIDYSDFFDDLDDLDKIDWPLMSAQMWNDTSADGDRKRRRQAEFLVHGFFPWTLVESIGVMTEQIALEVQQTLTATGGHSPQVVRQPRWYY
ncbi:MAG: DUF4433 domain-containing protein [Acidobacteriaceae bacterium]